jgi:hypothetical protein
MKTGNSIGLYGGRRFSYLVILITLITIKVAS